MSIDATIVGVRSIDGELKLTLEKRDKYTPAGQETLVITNEDVTADDAARLIGCDVWGGSGVLMLGDRKLADREGYVAIRLVTCWRGLVLGRTRSP